MKCWLSVAGLTDLGRQRELNEDRLYYKVVQSSDEGPTGLFVVADGMGGHLAGEVASHWAVGTLKRELAPLFRPQDPSVTRRLDAEALAAVGSGVTIRLGETDLARLLEHAIERANQVLLGYAHKHPDQAGGMGSTLTLAVVEDDRATVAHVGDSRAYLWHDGRLRPLTEDHSVPGALLKQGQITANEAHEHPHRHVLYRCLGLKAGLQVDITPPVPLHPGDALLLCSDGLWDMVYPTERLAAFLASEASPQAICRRLVDAANDAGGEDNVTVVLVRMEERDA
ncbi:MAG TPA: PP2C family serine/threonine-protein phosphatase [Anaerolineae bacterium]|nr:PP2C family serine/threonine-protein phosphatase [Anaerolineae bacterium]